MTRTAPKTVVITGTSRGIGQVTALRFMKEGWRVISCARGPLPDDLVRDDNWQHHIQVDLGAGDAVDVLIREVKAILNGDPLHALINNAGVSPKTPFKERLGILNGPIDGWRAVFELNFFTRCGWPAGLPLTCTKARGRSSISPPSPGITSIPSPDPPIPPARRPCPA